MKLKTFYPHIFISDTHLGFSGSNPKALLEFLKSVECDILYLVGDIFDLWAMKDRPYWNEYCNDVIRHILKMSHKGTKIVYIIGNHDDAIRSFIPFELGEQITITNQHIHHSINGKNILIIHGDQFDFVSKWMSVVGSKLYDVLIKMNCFVTYFRKLIGFKSYWSFSAFIKRNTKQALSAIKNFENMAMICAKQNGCGAVICGHIHTEKISEKYGMIYMNCGDWVESLTALVETKRGEFEIIRWKTID